MENKQAIEQFLVPEKVTILNLEASKAFETLTDKEKFYTHWFARACWAGAPIVFNQVSEESPLIFELIMTLFSKISVGDLRDKVLKSGKVEDKEFEQFLNYIAIFLGNNGNYKSFGDTKYIPRVTKQSFRTIVESSSLDDKKAAERVNLLLDKVLDRIYSLEKKDTMLNYPELGTSSYYSPNILKEDIELASRFMATRNISPYNTRLFKETIKGEEVLNLKIAALTCKKEQVKFENRVLIIEYGDYQKSYFEHIIYSLKKALEYTANDTQKQMIQKYVEHFTTGDIEAHKDSQRFWVKDIQPSVETNIGFIESYRDPAGIRGEFEGFVAVVDKETSKKFGELVNNAPEFLKLLPWTAEFEKEKFRKPDFTSLEIVAFCCSGVPAGINIPNYDDIRQNDGFKNVSLGNVLRARKITEKVTFIRDSDQEDFKKYVGESFEVQVGGHELLGHGSGKLIYENDAKGITNPLTKKPLETWYKEGETYDTVFGALGSSFEECRAECVGVVLSANSKFLDIFGHKSEAKENDAHVITYINWLSMARAGVLGLEFYSPEKGRWRQAHMQGRYAILQVMLEAGEGFVTINKESNEVELDRSKIMSVGVPAVNRFLNKIHVLKAVADIEGAKALYKKYTTVTPEFLKLRDVVLKNKKPRMVFVQHDTVVSGNEVKLISFPGTPEGMINSFVHRFGMMFQ